MVEGLESGVVAGIVAGVLMLALAILTTGVTVVVTLYCKRRRTLKHKGRDKGIRHNIFYRVYFESPEIICMAPPMYTHNSMFPESGEATY